MAQHNIVPPPLESKVTHGKANNIKFLLVEAEQNDQPIRLKAFFHQQVAADDRDRLVHWTEPVEYQRFNPWERDEDWHSIPVQPPPGVQFRDELPEFGKIPVIKYAQKGEDVDGIEIEDDNYWLKKYVGVEFVHIIFPGQTGLFLLGSVVAPQYTNTLNNTFTDDIRRLRAVRNKKVVIKLYFTHDMVRSKQMDRLYEETLAHCELKHPNIVDTYAVRFRVRKAQPNKVGAINAINGKTDIHSIIIMEYSRVGSFCMLMKTLGRVENGYDYYHLYLQDMIAGLVYLHSTGRAHREFNYTNCLAVPSKRSIYFNKFRWNVDNTEAQLLQQSVIKICDFGYTKKFDQATEQQLMQNWQSMDVMDLARNVLWHCRKHIGAVDLQLQRELYEIVKFLMDDDVQRRLENLKLLKMKKEDEGKEVREFMNDVAEDGSSRSFDD